MRRPDDIALEQISPVARSLPSVSLSRVREAQPSTQIATTENQGEALFQGTWAVESWSDPKVNITKYLQWGTEFNFDPPKTPDLAKVALSFTPDPPIIGSPEFIAIELEFINKAIADISEKRTIGVALYLTTRQGNEYHEAQQQIVEIGKHTLIYALQNKLWKTEHSNWQHQLPFPVFDQIRTMGVTIYNCNTGDHIRIAGFRTTQSASFKDTSENP